MKQSNLPKGKLGEDIATKFLLKKGYKIIARNFRARYGEIDIICIKDKRLHFVEVKTRYSLEFGTPEEAVTPWKLREVIKTAEYFLILHPNLPRGWQVDVIAVTIDEATRKVHIEHFPSVTS